MAGYTLYKVMPLTVASQNPAAPHLGLSRLGTHADKACPSIISLPFSFGLPRTNGCGNQVNNFLAVGALGEIDGGQA